MSEQPKRVRLSRKKGWRMPPNTVKVDRSTRWGNPWVVGLRGCGCRAVGECSHNNFRCETAADAVDAYRSWRDLVEAKEPQRSADFLAPLRGKNLACWCPLDQPCHADVLLKLANRPEDGKGAA